MYNQIAAYYDQLFPLSQEKVEWIKEKLHLKPGSRVLDLGCGSGDLVIALARAGCQVKGIDNDGNMVEKARGKIQNAGIEGAWVSQEDMLNYSVSKRFNNIICIGNTIPHLPNKKALISGLKLAYRTLTPGGKILLQTVNFDQDGVEHKQFPVLNAADGDVKFHRWYTPVASNRTKNNEKRAKEEQVNFNVRLEILSENRELRDTVPLLVLPQSYMKAALSKAGFKKIATYCGFSHELWHKNCGGTVYLAER